MKKKTFISIVICIAFIIDLGLIFIFHHNSPSEKVSNRVFIADTTKIKIDGKWYIYPPPDSTK